jgi:hypothetical protein
VTLLRYVGARPYTEFKWEGRSYGFSRGMERNDIPDSFIEAMILPGIENGVTMWQVEDDTLKAAQEKAIEMKATMEEPAEVVEETEVVEESPSVDLDSMTRAQLMSWCSERGLPTASKDKKVELLARAKEHLGE